MERGVATFAHMTGLDPVVGGTMGEFILGGPAASVLSFEEIVARAAPPPEQPAAGVFEPVAIEAGSLARRREKAVQAFGSFEHRFPSRRRRSCRRLRQPYTGVRHSG